MTQLRNDSRFAGIDGSGIAVAVIHDGLDRLSKRPMDDLAQTILRSNLHWNAAFQPPALQYCGSQYVAGRRLYRSPLDVPGDILEDDVRRLKAAGGTVISAAGNSDKNRQNQNVAAPAIFSTLSVEAVWKDGVKQKC